MRRPFVGGNWKMNTDRTEAVRLAGAVHDAIHADAARADIAVFPPFPYLIGVHLALRDRGSTIRVGAQDAYFEPRGAFTGEVSIPMIRDCGATVALVGHSERRHVLGESDELIARKTAAVLDAGLDCVLCVGETLDQRTRGETDAVNERQLRSALAGISAAAAGVPAGDAAGDPRLTIAYEPVWAIGTGKTASPDDAQAAHARVRAVLADLFGDDLASRIRIQYGGSVTPSNAADLFAQPDVDGGLVGGASLKVDDFVAIVCAAAASADRC